MTRDEEASGPRMNIKKYEAFIRAVELGSLSKAAEELGYTQSGISHMMQSLEDEVGFPLMVRTSAGILPNPEGEMLLPTIRQLLSTNEALEQYIAKIKGVDIGHIRIASYPSVAAYWLPTIIRNFQKDYPNVDIQIMEAGSDTIEDIMRHREADLCLYAGGENQEFEWLPLCRDQLLALVPHPVQQGSLVGNAAAAVYAGHEEGDCCAPFLEAVQKGGGVVRGAVVEGERKELGFGRRPFHPEKAGGNCGKKQCQC